MARGPRRGGADPFADLAKKIEVLEREMAAQRIALERLKSLGPAPRVARAPAPVLPVRKSA